MFSFPYVDPVGIDVLFDKLAPVIGEKSELEKGQNLGEGTI